MVKLDLERKDLPGAPGRLRICEKALVVAKRMLRSDVACNNPHSRDTCSQPPGGSIIIVTPGITVSVAFRSPAVTVVPACLWPLGRRQDPSKIPHPRRGPALSPLPFTTTWKSTRRKLCAVSRFRSVTGARPTGPRRSSLPSRASRSTRHLRARRWSRLSSAK